MNIEETKNIIKECINEKKLERNYDVMDAFGITPEFDKLNLFSPQIAAVINSVPGAPVLFAGGVLTIGAIYSAVIYKHYATKDIKALKELRRSLNNPEVRDRIEAMSHQELVDEITKSKSM